MDATVRVNINAAYPGLAQESDESVEAIIKECGAEASKNVKSVAIAYLLIAGVVFFVCGGYFSKTRNWWFLLLGVLGFVVAALRARSDWKRELRSQLARKYAMSPQGGGSAA